MELDSPTNITSGSWDEKVVKICELLHALPPNKITPREFIVHFLNPFDLQLALLGWLWAVDPGLNSSMSLMKTIHNKVTKTEIGREAWKESAQQEEETCDTLLTSELTPFLYILMATLQNQHGPITVVHEDEVIINNDIDPTEIPLDVDAIIYGKLLNGSEQLNKRFHMHHHGNKLQTRD
ncbi:hypothetical protein MJO28_003498 [Puccinia striiformis f. sp. tritici]|uniref:Uncharacterized protein n=1 Tax=Puccinia striiformis f. sp. tritici TaxID=168172 RepID=A0ACC0EV44_9BASI|nr:hypothetical protein MJO28_003498 [Puccinia striiformis f. sp. tritici]